MCAWQGGFIWLFYGSASLPADERPPIPFVPELEDPSWKPVYGEIEFECNHWSVFENAIDMAHIHYLHNDTFGNQVRASVEPLRQALPLLCLITKGLSEEVAGPERGRRPRQGPPRGYLTPKQQSPGVDRGGSVIANCHLSQGARVATKPGVHACRASRRSGV